MRLRSDSSQSIVISVSMVDTGSVRGKQHLEKSDIILEGKGMTLYNFGGGRRSKEDWEDA